MVYKYRFDSMKTEAARHLLASSPPFPSKTHCRSCASSASPAPAVTSMPLAQNFPTSVLLQEQCDEYKLNCVSLGKRKHPRLYSSYRFVPCMHWKTGTSGRKLMVTGTSGKEDFDNSEQSALPPLQTHTNPSLSSTMESAATETKKSMDVEANSEKALSGSIQKAMLDDDSEIIADDLDGPQSHSWTKLFFNGEVTVRSIRLQERRSKERRVIKVKAVVRKRRRFRCKGEKGNTKEGITQDFTLESFLARHRTKVTAEEESELIARTQDLLKLEKVKNRLKSDIGHEPNLVEWSKEVGVSCRVLQSRIRSGISSRNKLIYANLWLVAHVAKPYLYCGLSHMDLFMAGISGIVKGLEKFVPEYGCRFSTYAFWWIKDTIYRKGVLQSYTFIDLSVHMHKLLDKISSVRRLCIAEGNLSPTKEDIAERMDITVDRLEKLLILERLRSGTCLIIKEDEFVDPLLTFEKETMQQHILDLVANLLTPRERHAVRLRYGLEDGRRNPLSEIGYKMGISRERARQLEETALQKLRQHIEREGLTEEYTRLSACIVSGQLTEEYTILF